MSSCCSIVRVVVDRQPPCLRFRAGRPPRNKGLRYPADPPKVEEIVAVMRAAGDRPHGRRLRALIVILWRAGLRVHEPDGAVEAGAEDLSASGIDLEETC